MKSITKAFVVTAALFGATFSALGARAADTTASFEQQLEMTDGYYPQYTVHPHATRPASAQTQLQDREFDLERAAASTDDKPVPLAEAARSLEQPMQTASAPSVNADYQ
jgi:hypothetical protein